MPERGCLHEIKTSISSTGNSTSVVHHELSRDAIQALTGSEGGARGPVFGG